MALAVALVMGGVLTRVVLLQTVQADAYREASIDQRLRTETLRAERGTLFDRSGVELALSVPSQTIAADPRYVRDPRGTAGVLGGLLGLGPERIADLAQRLDSPT
jgi:cell division protein FtsI/penicillin-binding protein 2